MTFNIYQTCYHNFVLLIDVCKLKKKIKKTKKKRSSYQIKPFLKHFLVKFMVLLVDY